MTEFRIIWPESKGIIVRAVEPVIVGIWSDDEKRFLMPDTVDCERLLPYKWRKAFKRKNGRFWYHDKARIRDGQITGGDVPHMTLTDYRGRHMVTLYALVNRNE